MGAVSRKPYGSEGNPHYIDKGTRIRHASPLRGPAGTGRPTNHLDLHILGFDADKLHRFYLSVARAIILSDRIRKVPMKPVTEGPHKDDLMMRGIIATMGVFNALPEEIELPDEREIKEHADELANMYGEQFMLRIQSSCGVKAACDYLVELAELREGATKTIESIYRSVAQHNARAEEDAQDVVVALSAIKFSATIIVAGLTLPVVGGWVAAAGVTGEAGLATFGVGTAYSVGLKWIKEWEHASRADLVVIAVNDAATETKKEAIGRTAEAMEKSYAAEAQNSGSALRKVEWLSKRLKNGGSERDARKLIAAKAAAAEASEAGWIARGLKAVPYVFFAISAWEAAETLKEDLNPGKSGHKD